MHADDFAQQMALLCAPKFAALVLAVPARHKGNADLCRSVVGAISHADKMATLAGPPMADIVLELAARFRDEADSSLLTEQETAVRQLVGLAVHAHIMVQTVPAAADEVFSEVRMLTDGLTLKNRAHLTSVESRLASARTTISNACHRALLEGLAHQ